MNFQDELTSGNNSYIWQWKRRPRVYRLKVETSMDHHHVGGALKGCDHSRGPGGLQRPRLCLEGWVPVRGEAGMCVEGQHKLRQGGHERTCVVFLRRGSGGDMWGQPYRQALPRKEQRQPQLRQCHRKAGTSLSLSYPSVQGQWQHEMGPCVWVYAGFSQCISTSRG